MKIVSFTSKKFIVTIFIIFITIILLFLLYFIFKNNNYYFMGAIVVNTNVNHKENISPIKKEEADSYFRPSNSPSLNTKTLDIPSLDGLSPNVSKNAIDNKLLSSPENSIINYYSILREAANPSFFKSAGCGSIGTGKSAYPASYNFFTKEYMKKLSYNKYLKSFKNILHINLIKLMEIDTISINSTRFFIELETIEGTSDKSGAFKYYYGFIDIVEEEDIFKINNIELFSEVYLCAPYHGWSYMGENVVDIEYGTWCNMILERLPTIHADYVKCVPFKSPDGNEYMVKFITLTNDTDIKIGDYIKDKNNKWILININTQQCLENSTNK